MQEQTSTIKEDAPAKDAPSTTLPEHDADGPTMLNPPKPSKVQPAAKEREKRCHLDDGNIGGKRKRNNTKKFKESSEQNPNYLKSLRFHGTAQCRKFTSSEEQWRKFDLYRKGRGCWTETRSSFRKHIKIPPEKRPFAHADNYAADQGNYPPTLSESENLALLIREKNNLTRKTEQFGRRGWSAMLPPDFVTPSSDLGAIARYREGEPVEHWEEIEKLAHVNYKLRIEYSTLKYLQRHRVDFGWSRAMKNRVLTHAAYVSIPSYRNVPESRRHSDRKVPRL